ncbi:MAG: inositol monophosphatase family protein [Actinomycetota bacterium]|nr:inositol monophosphatase family protein [Actinomycetota bacterium]
MNIDQDDLLELACRLAIRAGDAAQTRREELGIGLVVGDTLVVETKSTSIDLVTEVDRVAEATIVGGLADARPDDGVLGEEGASVAGTSRVRWIIDPIDGTTNLVYGIPSYSVSIAAEVDGAVIVGAVYDPAGEVLFAAAAGRGATRNGEPVACTSPRATDPTAHLAQALVATGFGFSANRRRGQAEVLVTLLPQIRDIRRFGSAALDLCSVACGRVDGYYEKGLNYWDYAAGRLIASEAGAVLGDLRGGPGDSTFLLAAAPHVFEPLRSALRSADADERP